MYYEKVKQEFKKRFLFTTSKLLLLENCGDNRAKEKPLGLFPLEVDLK